MIQQAKSKLIRDLGECLTLQRHRPDAEQPQKRPLSLLEHVHVARHETPMIDDDVFVRRKRQADVDLKSGTMAMLVARRDHFNAATGNTMIVGFQSLYFT